jgi:flagellar basal body-associated protein FliL
MWPAVGVECAFRLGEVQYSNNKAKKEGSMFLILAVVLVVLWLGGFTLFHVTGWFIHLLLIFAVISIIMHFIGGRRAV